MISDYLSNNDFDEYIKYTATEANTAWNNGYGELTRDDLAQYGFFRKFSHFEQDEGGYSYLYESVLPPVTLLYGHQWDLLASGIPAMSFAAAVNSMDI